MSNSENWVSHIPEEEVPQPQDSTYNTNININSSRNDESNEQTPSPPTAFEKFFLPLKDPVGFARIASSLRSPKEVSRSNRPLSRSITSESAHTSDFVSAAEELELEEDLNLDLNLSGTEEEHEKDHLDPEDISIENNLYKNDILGLSHPPPILEEIITRFITDEESESELRDMASKKKSRSNNRPKTKPTTPTTDNTTVSVKPISTPESKPEPKPIMTVTDVVEPAPTPSEPAPTLLTPTPAPVTTEPEVKAEEVQHLDVVDHIYVASKTAWAFSKEHVVIFRPFMNLTETIATKVLSATTSGAIPSLQVADENITKHVKGIDKDLVDPAILKLWTIIEPLVGKGDEVVKEVMGFIHKTPMIEEGPEGDGALLEKESSEVNSPEISTPSITA